jgi:murein DD-endopeptidase MepM/ murein hydrolase activator NlpD
MTTYNPGAGFTLTSQAGQRTDPFTGEITIHRGDDWAASAGTSISAAAAGQVVFSGSMSGYGNTVVLRHEINGEYYYSLYAHMQDIPTLNKGAWVLPGESVGQVGNTGGRSTGPHLHFEVLAGPKLNLQKGHPFIPPAEFDFGDPYVYFRRSEFNREFRSIAPTTTNFLAQATTITPERRDPLTLDLDGNGLDTTGINTTNPILFDHDGDGIKTATGWVKRD